MKRSIKSKKKSTKSKHKSKKSSTKKFIKKSSKKNNITISLKTAKYYGDKFHLNWDIIPLKWWRYGIEVELEHGSKLMKLTNITHDDIKITAKIALAHLIEFPDYYQRLKMMETKAEKYWQNKKVDIFI